MHNNFYFLRQLSNELHHRLTDFTLVSCFSQNKDELIIELNNREKSFFIKAYLSPTFSCLSFPAQFNRAKKNSVDLFEEVILKEFTGVTQFENERSFSLNFSHGLSIVFKMHGNRSNVLLTQDQRVAKIFRNQFKEDYIDNLESLHKPIDWSKDVFWKYQDQLHEKFFTLGKPVWQYLEMQQFAILKAQAKWNLFQQTIEKLRAPKFHIIKDDNKIRLTLLPLGNVLATYADPIKAINDFFLQYTTNEAFQKEYNAIVKQLSSKIMACESYIEKNRSKLQEIKVDSRFKLWADVLMAHLNVDIKGKTQIELTDFEQHPITIKLKPELSIQKNAEIFYRKSKNQEIEINKIQESIDQKQKELLEASNQLSRLELVDNLEGLRQLFPKKNKEPISSMKRESQVPFHVVEFQGFQIWIGKNASNNDELTQRYAFKEDLWLHARDVAGSHVVIKHQANKPFPKEVIERAAELAAFNSKRKNESLCPVIYTQKKFVRKRKGDPPGAVVVEKEKVIMVTPKL